MGKSEIADSISSSITRMQVELDAHNRRLKPAETKYTEEKEKIEEDFKNRVIEVNAQLLKLKVDFCKKTSSRKDRIRNLEILIELSKEQLNKISLSDIQDAAEKYFIDLDIDGGMIARNIATHLASILQEQPDQEFTERVKFALLSDPLRFHYEEATAKFYLRDNTLDKELYAKAADKLMEVQGV